MKKILMVIGLVFLLCSSMFAFDTSFVKQFVGKEVSLIYGDSIEHHYARCLIIEIIDDKIVKGKTTTGFYYIEIDTIISIQVYSSAGIH